MSFEHGTARSVVDLGFTCGGQILNKGAVEPDVETLSAVADGENGFVEIEGVLQKQLLDGFTGWVGGIAGGGGVVVCAGG